MIRFPSLTHALALISFTFIHAAPVHAAGSAEDALAGHTDEFREEIIRVTDGVHMAVGYALANSIMIEGEDGVIIVDTTESPASARRILGEFRKITDKPVRAIIYTHFHADHIGGAKVFAGDAGPDVYSHDTTGHLVADSYAMLSPIIRARSIRQFGNMIPASAFLNCGIGPRLNLSLQGGYLPATVTFRDSLEVTISGVKMVLVHAPGETDDQLFVWLPEKKALLCGDNFYKSFPNLYAIRGTRYRDVREWAESLQKMINLGPEFLVPSHTRPITGAEEIRQRLSNYRDAISFVHDKTVEGMNEGLTPDELVETVRLPPHLAEDPWLREFYGTVEWSVRSVFNGYLGWFDGNATNLAPLGGRARGERMIRMAGGREPLRTQAAAAFDAKDWQWAAELLDHLIATDPADDAAKKLKARCLLELGRLQTSANGRNYYMSAARELDPAVFNEAGR